MDAIELLHERVSCPVLEDPAPTPEQLEVIFKAALRSPDHGALRPWRFLTVQGENRSRLGELFLKAALSDNPDLSVERQEKIRKMPLRSPLVIVVISANRKHPKVPVLEQQISAGCAAQNILHAAHALNLGGMWRTGDMAYHPVVKAGLSVAEQETVVGYIYMGTASKMRKTPQHDILDFVSEWIGS
ncbi:MAG: nitroreductase family protein [Neptuniibacter sp.]